MGSAQIDAPDVLDLFASPYRPGAIAPVKDPNEDPGRGRLSTLLASTYGTTEREVAGRLRHVTLMGSGVSVHRKIAGALGRVATTLERLSLREPELTQYFKKLGGGFAWRKIAGTGRLSAHSYGIAIYIDTSYSDYWRWQGDSPVWRNRVPRAIVNAFEQHGFIWGGRWYHFDTMHFEYRPELLDEHCQSRNPRVRKTSGRQCQP